MTNENVSHTSVSLNVNFNSKRGFKDTKIYRTNSKAYRLSEFCFVRQDLTKFTKSSKVAFSMQGFIANILKYLIIF